MPAGHQLPVLRQSLQRFSFPLCVVTVNVIEHTRLKNKKCAVDPSRSGLRLFRELCHLVVIQLNVTKTRRRSNSRQCSQLAVRAMESQQIVQIQIRNPIPQVSIKVPLPK